jgi:hypothetical protein
MSILCRYFGIIFLYIIIACHEKLQGKIYHMFQKTSFMSLSFVIKCVPATLQECGVPRFDKSPNANIVVKVGSTKP